MFSALRSTTDTKAATYELRAQSRSFRPPKWVFYLKKLEFLRANEVRLLIVPEMTTHPVRKTTTLTVGPLEAASVRTEASVTPGALKAAGANLASN